MINLSPLKAPSSSSRLSFYRKNNNNNKSDEEKTRPTTTKARRRSSLSRLTGQNKLSTTETTKRVSFSDKCQVFSGKSIILTPKEEDEVWYTEEELDFIMMEARVRGDLLGLQEGMKNSKLNVSIVLKEQSRQRKNDLDRDWGSLARVSRSISIPRQRSAHLKGMEDAKLVSKYNNLDNEIKTTKGRRKFWMIRKLLKVGPDH